MRLISSQVSTLAPEWTGRWSKARRLRSPGGCWSRCDLPISSRTVFLTQAAQAYAMLDQHPEEAIQVIPTYMKGVSG
jgi:hypothetical protein